MWSRGELKDRAKAVLRSSYWKAFLVSLVLGFAAGGSGGGSSGYSFSIPGNNQGASQYYSDGASSFGSQVNPGFVAAIFVAFIAIFAIILVITLAFRVFLGYSLEVGCKRYFVQSTQTVVNLNNMGFAFNRNRYWSIVVSMLWKDLFIFLWTLLFIIPGIVKSYAYAMVPYILADNPNIGYKRALEMSKQMTNNQKLDMFVLDLSFIGWSILGFLACCVGLVFLAPYINATKAELYIVLKQNALAQGSCTPEELLLNPTVMSQGMSQGTVL